MNTLLSAFLIQLALCTVLFAMLFYLVAANAKLNKEIEAETERVKASAKELA